MRAILYAAIACAVLATPACAEKKVNADDNRKAPSTSERAKITKDLAGFGVYWSEGSSGGYTAQIACKPKQGCWITEGQLGVTDVEHGKKYRFPFIPADWEWAIYEPGGDWHKMKSFLGAKMESYDLHYHYVPPPKGSHYCGSTIQPGESCVSGGLEPDTDSLDALWKDRPK